MLINVTKDESTGKYETELDAVGLADLQDNKEVTIDATLYTEPVEILPSEGKNGMKKATVTLSNIPSGGKIYYKYIANDGGDVSAILYAEEPISTSGGHVTGYLLTISSGNSSKIWYEYNNVEYSYTTDGYDGPAFLFPDKYRRSGDNNTECMFNESDYEVVSASIQVNYAYYGNSDGSDVVLITNVPISSSGGYIDYNIITSYNSYYRSGIYEEYTASISNSKISFNISNYVSIYDINYSDSNAPFDTCYCTVVFITNETVINS